MTWCHAWHKLPVSIDFGGHMHVLLLWRRILMFWRPVHFDWVIIVRSVRLSSPQCSHAKHLIGHYYLAGNWAADEWASDGHLWMEAAAASTLPLLNKANSVHLITVVILLILMRIILHFQTCILDTTNIFVDGKKRSIYVVVMVTRRNVWKWRRLDHGGRFKGHLPPIFKIHPFV